MSVEEPVLADAQTWTAAFELEAARQQTFGGSDAVLELLDERGNVLRTIEAYWNRERKFDFQAQAIRFDFKIADTEQDATLKADMIKLRKLRVLDNTYDRKRITQPQRGEARVWYIQAIDTEFVVDAGFQMA